ncbi:hypothetical protein [Lactiplantibacillus plantarum]|uniref:hypothetical protein n=1 Tax=Lactiplantibacillus plantarum TaxID=1590 RepID=UPI0022381223|nr:hypothetical protein [Lactiplantibacillus plantarum]MCW6101414.1 hypothetical protein [Lactiplantibacillus plantarum]MCW6104528.1 hypothetical protein [Lactiplantibacillus plantarum]
MRAKKKPAIIEYEVFQDTITCFHALQDKLGLDPLRVSYHDPDHPILKIETLQGTMTANVGDFIIKGVCGELYSCKPDIFKKNYDLLD